MLNSDLDDFSEIIMDYGGDEENQFLNRFYEDGR